MKNKIKLIAIFLTLPLLAMLILPSVESQTKVKTAAEEFKNIKVLKDMPADQMGKVMNQMSASLGVDCKFCHVSTEDFSKEGGEHKDTAREMLTMTFDINKKFFNARTEINCNSCHQGKSHPQAVFPLTPQVSPERPKQPEKRPTIDEILAKYETALGGKAKLAKITSRYIKAQRIEPDGKTIEAEEIWTKGNKSSIISNYPNYVVKEIYDGTNAWKLGNGEVIPLQPDEIEQPKRDAQIFANPNLKAIYPQMDVRFFDKLDGKEVWIVQATTADKKRERLVFDLVSGLLVRRSAAFQTVLGSFVYQVDYQDYKDFGGVKLATTIKFAVPNIYSTRKILEVKNNVNVDDKVFMK